MSGPSFCRQSPNGRAAESRRAAVLRAAAGALAALLAVPSLAATSFDPLDPSVLEFRPPMASGRSLTLEQAVDQALLVAPELAAARADVVSQQALQQIADGQFDGTLIGRLAGDYDQRVLRDRRLALARQRRQNFEVPAQTFDDVANSFERSLEGNFGRRIFADCPEGSVLTITDPDGNIVERIQCPTAAQLRRAAELTRLYEVLAPFLPPEFEQLLTQQIQIQRTTVENVIRALRLAIPPLRRAFLDLGPLPDEEESFRLDLQAAWARQFGNGIAVAPVVSLSSFEENFVGKPFDERFGGLGLPNLYTAEVALAVAFPLGRDRGRAVVSAGLRSAEQLTESARAAQIHTAAVTALSVTEAYWRAAAASQRLELLQSSIDTQMRAQEITAALIDSDLLPAAEATRVEARLAQLRGDLEQARLDWHRSRIGLARSMGLELSALMQAPTTVDPLPSDTEPLNAAERQQGLEEAVARRFDVASARLQIDSAELLSVAAQNNLRRRFDLTLVGSYASAFEGRSWGEGLEETLTDNFAGPSLQLQFEVGFPVRNRVARGQLRQARALAQEARITHRDAERSVRLGAASELATLEQTLQVLRERQLSLASYEELLTSDQERLRLGDGTLIDSVTTEQRLTTARLDELSARLDVALALARWRFVTGQLVVVPDGPLEEVAAQARFQPPLTTASPVD